MAKLICLLFALSLYGKSHCQLLFEESFTEKDLKRLADIGLDITFDHPRPPSEQISDPFLEEFFQGKGCFQNWMQFAQIRPKSSYDQRAASLIEKVQ